MNIIFEVVAVHSAPPSLVIPTYLEVAPVHLEVVPACLEVIPIRLGLEITPILVLLLGLYTLFSSPMLRSFDLTQLLIMGVGTL